jgi:nucleotide-binding universal stress UspA family protein
MGLGEHGVTARLMQRETALQVMRAASVPVLALPRDAWGIPHSAVAAIDFTASSETAAAAALDLLGGEGTLYVAHVLPRTMIPHAEPPSWGDESTAGTLKRLEAVVRRLDPPRGVHVEYVLLHGEPAHELLAFAEEMKADLVAVGAHGRSALGRLLMGSVSTRLVRTAECWVLVAPADGSAAPL